MRQGIFFFLLLLTIGCAGGERETAVGTPTAAPPLPTNTPAPTANAGPSLQPIITDGLFKPVYLTHAFDERLFIVQQFGVIRVWDGGDLLPRPFLDIQDVVQSEEHEQGLFSMAFHPDYAREGMDGYGRFYVYYTSDRHGTAETIISRFRVDPAAANQADPTSEEIILRISQPYNNHNGGQLHFGPDGYLYAGLGDGGGASDPQENGQDVSSILGSIIRIDVDAPDAPYAIPADNPQLSDDARAIWAYGLRNPWRFSFDRETGDMFIGDVGQSGWEEINLLPADAAPGQNFGWDVMEGSNCYQEASCRTAGLTLPIYEYDHAQGCSVTGGYVYRGAAIPTLTGTYLFSDYCEGKVWGLSAENGRWQAETLLEIPEYIVSFGEDVHGELYVVSHFGTIYRLTP